MKVVVCSGYFNPIHAGHLAYLRAARSLGDYLAVIVNNDDQAVFKTGGKYFMGQSDRRDIVSELRCVDADYGCLDKDPTVNLTLRHLRRVYPYDDIIFANGGDVTCEEQVREADTCRELGIKMVFGVGGAKIRSSRYYREKS